MNTGRTILAAAAVFGLAVSPALAEEVTLTGASCFPIGSPVSKPFEAVVDEVNKRGKGVVQIDLKGGAPAIGSPFTLTQKMSRGAYDVVGCTEAYFGNVLPEAPVLRFAEKPYSELRKNGGLDYMEKLLQEKEEAEAQMVRAAQECVSLREQCADLHRGGEAARMASKVSV